MKLSVIILNYNVQYFLEQCITSVQRSIKGIDAEIIVIDNNSPDESCAMMKTKFSEITLIENKENVGFSKANNQAVAIAKGEYVCILNPDTAVAEDTFIVSLKYAESIKNLGALGIYLMDGTGSFLPESKRNLPTPKASLLKLLGAGKNYYANHISENKNGEVAVLVGAFMLLKKSVYKEVKGFDEDYFMYGEDIDFSYKITKAGYKNYYLGSSVILHYKGESTQKEAEYLDRFYGAMHIFYKKHFNTNLLFDSFVKFGVFVAKNFNKPSKKRSNISSENNITYVLTENIILLKNISENINTEIKTTSKTIFSDEVLINTNFIFDVDYMSYSQIFMVMRKLRGKGNTFRISPPGCNFILGSDQSDQKGSVLVF
ncbi:MAG: glycosyl transferase family 2 [Flavobacterium sp.]|nr:MAG: glycosyl transferase family 2 [Flavobacterium sp.]